MSSMRSIAFIQGLLLIAGVMLLSVGFCRAQDEPDELTLKCVSGKTVADILTPQRMLTDGTKVVFNGAEGTLKIGRKSYKVSGAFTRGRYYIAVDGNGDGKLDRKEIHAISRQNNSISVTLDNASNQLSDEPLDEDSDQASEDDSKKADDDSQNPPRTCTFVLDNVSMYNRSGKVAVIHFNLYPAWGMQTDYENTKITLIDTNMDGLFIQDSGDAIAIGSKVAAPLKKIHRIGENLYEVAVSEDGSKMTLKKRLDVNQGTVQLAKPSPLWKGLVLESDDGAFDVLQDGNQGLPAGIYRVVCGALCRGKEAAYIAEAPKQEYKIKAGKNLRLQIGLPAQLAFKINTIGGKVNISPRDISVIGGDGETYRFNVQMRSLPTIHYLAGKRVLQKDKMEYG